MKLKQVKLVKPVEWLGSKQTFRASDGYELEHLAADHVVSIAKDGRLIIVDQTGAEMEIDLGSDQPGTPVSVAGRPKRSRQG